MAKKTAAETAPTAAPPKKARAKKAAEDATADAPPKKARAAKADAPTGAPPKKARASKAATAEDAPADAPADAPPKKARAAKADAAEDAPADAPPKKARAAKAAMAEDEAEGGAGPGLEVVIMSDREHIEVKGMYAGGNAPESASHLQGLPPGAQVYQLAEPMTPSLATAFNELVVNASDHAIRHEGARGAGRVRRIDVTIGYDAAGGPQLYWMAVENDGPGIPVELHAAASATLGRDVYVPEVVATFPRAGTNHGDRSESLSGGINGLGLKVVLTRAAWARLVTVAAAAGGGSARRRFEQEYRARMADVGPAAVAATREPTRTRLEVDPDWAQLGYGAGPSAAQAREFADWARLRLHEVAAYTGCAVTLNGEPVVCAGAAGLARAYWPDPEAAGPDGSDAGSDGSDAGSDAGPAGSDAGTDATGATGAPGAGERLLTTKLKAPGAAHVWDLALAVGGSGFRAVVNGVTTHEGTHAAAVRRLLADAARAAYERLTGEAAAGDVLAGVGVALIARVPGADWDSQRKERLSTKVAAYAPPAAWLKRAGEAAAATLRASARTVRIRDPDYEPAALAGGRQRACTELIICEGASAKGLFNAGLQANEAAATKANAATLATARRIGLITTRGVVPNALRISTPAPPGSLPPRFRARKLVENARLAMIADAAGLDYGSAHAGGAGLAYGALRLATDQDVDGTGKIAPLVLLWLHLFWPALFGGGGEPSRVGIFATPLIRAWPKGRAAKPKGKGTRDAPLEFYYLCEYEEWARGRDLSGWELKYYKGLGGHSKADAAAMFSIENYSRSCFALTVTAETGRLFELMYGTNSAGRQALLRDPPPPPSPAETARHRAARELPVDYVLRVLAIEFKRDAMRRALPRLDGLVEVTRKVVEVARRSTAQAKAFQVAARVADVAHYHHGGASIEGATVGMACGYLGGWRYPLLAGEGQFGDRHGVEPASARYVSVAFAPRARLLFPDADAAALDYLYDEGARIEPAEFAPVAPLCVLDDFNAPSEGWPVLAFGRDAADVAAAVRAFAAGDADLLDAAAEVARQAAAGHRVELPAGHPAAARFPLRAATAGWRGTVEVRPDARGAPREYAVGAYEIVPAAGGTAAAPLDLVRITEIPLGVKTRAYYAWLTGADDEPARKAAKPKAAKAKAKAAKPKASPRARRRCAAAGLFAKTARQLGDDTFVIEVWLTPENRARLEADYGNERLDAYEDALGLAAPLGRQLNFFVGERLVTFAGYLELLLAWAVRRRAVYATRTARDAALARARADLAAAVARYAAGAAAGGAPRALDDAAAAAELARQGYPRFDAARLARPGVAPLAEVITWAGPPGAPDGGADDAPADAPDAPAGESDAPARPRLGYAYILNLRVRDLTAAAAERAARRAAEAEAAAAEAAAHAADAPFPGARLWRAEFDAWYAHGQ